jgi:hypothetical protein
VLNPARGSEGSSAWRVSSAFSIINSLMLFGLSRREYEYAGGAAIVKSQCQMDDHQGKGCVVIQLDLEPSCCLSSTPMILV